VIHGKAMITGFSAWFVISFHCLIFCVLPR
jgi:hypothetical protein